jgi:hypothetical protein
VLAVTGYLLRGFKDPLNGGGVPFDPTVAVGVPLAVSALAMAFMDSPAVCRALMTSTTSAARVRGRPILTPSAFR